jgi:hypothetical protein
VGLKGSCATSADILEFRLGGVYARIGSVRSLRTTLISYSRQPSLQDCIANQIQINDLNQALPTTVHFMHVYEVRPRKDKRGFDLISDALPFGRLWYGEPDVQSYRLTLFHFLSRWHTTPYLPGTWCPVMKPAANPLPAQKLVAARAACAQPTVFRSPTGHPVALISSGVAS